MKLKIISWNVLHITHELNHCLNSSSVINKYGISKDVSGEKIRLGDIFRSISKVLDGNTIVCLQEVPGDLFDSLASELKDHSVYSLKYEREPIIKNKMDNPYLNPSEYLVTIVPSQFISTSVEQTSIELKTIGKGALIIRLREIYIINAHVPAHFNQDLRGELLNKLQEFIETNSVKKYIFIGDFNSNYLQLKNDLKEKKFLDYKVPQIKGDTRKGLVNGEIRMSKLDHIVIMNINVCKTWVEGNNDLSDHSMVGAIVIV